MASFGRDEQYDEDDNMVNEEIELTNKIINMPEVAVKKMIFSIGQSGRMSWEELNTFAEVYCK